MKNFVATQTHLHERAIGILKEYHKQKTMHDACASAIKAIEAGSDGYINSKEEFQANGDTAAGKMMRLHIEYFGVLKQITEPIMFKKHQINNAKEITNMELVEAYFSSPTMVN